MSIDYPGSVSFPVNINPIETSERLLGGLGGELNRAVKQVADRTAYLNAKVFNQGTATIANQFVLQGFLLEVGTARNYHLTHVAGGVGTEPGLNRAWMDGTLVALPCTADKVAVPTNPGGTEATWYVYLDGDVNDVYDVGIAASVPAGAMEVYEITVPAGHTANNLVGITAGRTCRDEAAGLWAAEAPPSADVVLADMPALDSADDYQVLVEVIASTGPAHAGEFEITSKTATGFTIVYHGQADAVDVTWTVLLIPS